MLSHLLVQMIGKVMRGTIIVFVLRNGLTSSRLMFVKCTVFIPLAAQGAYQSHFRWALIKTLISQFFSLK